MHLDGATPRRGRHRSAADALFSATGALAAALLMAALGWVLWDVVRQGLPLWSWSYLVDDTANAGRSGGLGPVLVATAAILGVALAVALPVGVASAVWLAEFASTGSGGAPGAPARRQRQLRPVRLALDTLAGVPSIVWGLFGSAFFCNFLGLGYSILAGGLTLACMMLPLLISTTEAGLSALPADWRQGGAALGMSRASLVWHVLLPAAAPALAAGTVLAVGRATAEAAALIFTSGYVDRMPGSLLDSGRALAVHIYDLSMNVPGGDRAAYGAASVLVVLVLAINTSAVAASRHWAQRRLAAH